MFNLNAVHFIYWIHTNRDVGNDFKSPNISVNAARSSFAFLIFIDISCATIILSATLFVISEENLSQGPWIVSTTLPANAFLSCIFCFAAFLCKSEVK